MGSSHCAICGQKFGMMSVKFDYGGCEICSSCLNNYFPDRSGKVIDRNCAMETEKKIDSLLMKGCYDGKIIPAINEYKQRLHEYSTDNERARERELELSRTEQEKEAEATAYEILERDQELLKNILLTTSDSIQGRVIEEYLGIVMGCVPIGMGFLTINTGDISNLFGKKSKLLEDKVRRSYVEAQIQLASEAKKRGANAVIGITQSTSNFLSNLTGLVLIGTAVKLKD